jgi:tetratricopeptide (TPR) repeat protein
MWFLLCALAALGSELSAGPDELLHLARERLRHGDWEGVRLVADEALSIPGDHQRTAQYLVAMSYEYGGDPQEALAIYEALEGAYDRAEIPEDLRFRRAECLGRLQRYREARQALRGLPRKDRPPLDQLKIDVLLGIWELELGHHRRAIRQLSRALQDAPSGVGTYYQALARHALLAQALRSAEQIEFSGSDRAKKRALEERAALIEIGNEQLAEIIRTDEVSFALGGFLELARAHAAVARAMLAESPVGYLTEEQQVLYRQMMAEQVEGIFVKATLYCDRGLELAARMDWTGEPVPSLRAEQAAIVAEVDSMSPPGP